MKWASKRNLQVGEICKWVKREIEVGEHDRFEKGSGWKWQIYSPSKNGTNSPAFSQSQQIHPLLIQFLPTSEGVFADAWATHQPIRLAAAHAASLHATLHHQQLWDVQAPGVCATTTHLACSGGSRPSSKGTCPHTHVWQHGHQRPQRPARRRYLLCICHDFPLGLWLAGPQRRWVCASHTAINIDIFPDFSWVRGDVKSSNSGSYL